MGAVSKVNKPYKNEIVLVMRAKRKKFINYSLSAHPSYARIQLTGFHMKKPYAHLISVYGYA